MKLLLRLSPTSSRFPRYNHSQHIAGFSTTATTSNGVDSLPTPAGRWPIVGHLPRMIQGGDSLANWSSFHQECGDHFLVNVFGKDIVVSRDVRVARRVLTGGKNPFRTPQNGWRKVFDEFRWPYLVPFAEGDEWRRRREGLAKSLLAEKDAVAYYPSTAEIAKRLAGCVDDFLPQHSTKLEVPLKKIVSMYTLEAVMKAATGVDFPALKKPMPRDAIQFASAVEDMFSFSQTVENNPMHTLFRTRPYQKLRSAWETMYGYPKQAIEPILEAYKSSGYLPEYAQNSMLPKLIDMHEQGLLSEEEVASVAVTAIAGAVDTTTQTFEYLVYNLATNPEAQEALVEAIGILGEEFTAEELNSVEYVRATLKESMRLTPTVGAHVRTLQEPLLVEEVPAFLPKGTLVLINYYEITRNPDLYSNPNCFLPERFLKGNTLTGGAKDSYAAIPFGHGPRKCAGTAFAEQSLRLGVVELLKKFRLSYDGPPLEQVEKMLLRPKAPLCIKYERR